MKVFKAYKEDVSMQKVVITVVGKDKVGIMARVCTYLADNGINILDISQKRSRILRR